MLNLGGGVFAENVSMYSEPSVQNICFPQLFTLFTLQLS